MSSVGGDHGSSMYNFAKEDVDSGFQIRQFNLTKKPEPMVQYDVDRKVKNKSRYSRTKTGEMVETALLPNEDDAFEM